MRTRSHCRAAPIDLAPSETELVRVARAFERACGREPTFDELRVLDAWVVETRTNSTLLAMVLKGAALVDLDDDGQPRFCLSTDAF
jgi:hypothetical protein